MTDQTKWLAAKAMIADRRADEARQKAAAAIKPISNCRLAAIWDGRAEEARAALAKAEGRANG